MVSSLRGVLVGIAALGLVACGDDGGTPSDAAVDTPLDMNDGCRALTELTGELVDWSSSAASFCGVFNATLTIRGGGSDTTNPNGRFELCAQPAAQTVIDVAYSATPSECTSPKEAYAVPAVLVVDKSIVDSGALFSARAMTPARQAEMFTQVGAPFEAARGQLVVHVVGTPVQVAISAAHAAAQAFDGTTWAAGDTGRDVFFPNAATGATQVMVGGATATSVTLEPGRFTYVTVRTIVTAR